MSMSINNRPVAAGSAAFIALLVAGIIANEGFSEKENFKLVSSFIDLKIQVQTHGSLVLARKDLGPNL